MPRYHIPREKRDTMDLSKYPEGFECGPNYVIQTDKEYPELNEYKFAFDTGPAPVRKKPKATTEKAKPKKEAKKAAKRGRK